MRGLEILSDGAAKIDTVHAWHDHIADDQVGKSFLCLFEPFFSVRGFGDLIIIRQGVLQESAQFGIVLYQQDKFGAWGEAILFLSVFLAGIIISILLLPISILEIIIFVEMVFVFIVQAFQPDAARQVMSRSLFFFFI